MNRHSVRLLAAAFAAVGAAGCFDDPTSSLRNGPDDLLLSHTAVAVVFGDSIQVEARAVDAQGNVLPITGATWTTDNASVASVAVAATQMPDEASSRAYILATNAAGGYTTVRVSSRGLTDSVRVVTMPDIVAPTGLAAVSGSGDTLIVTASAGMFFDAGTTVRVGANTTYLFSRTASQLKALVRGTVNGTVTIVHPRFGDGSNSSIVLDSVITTDVVAVNPAPLPAASVTMRAGGTYGNDIHVAPPAGTQFTATSTVTLGSTTAMLIHRSADSMVVLARGAQAATTVKVTDLTATAGSAIDSLRTTATVVPVAATFPAANAAVRDGALGLQTELKLTPPTGTTFTAASSAVSFGGAAANIIFRSADSIIAINAAAYTGPVKVTNLVVGAFTVDSLSTAGNVTLNAAAFPGTVAVSGTGQMLDTVTVSSGASATFTTGASRSVVRVNGVPGHVVSHSATEIKVIPVLSGTNVVSITNVIVGSSTIPTLTTAGTVAILTTSLDDGLEPANDAPGGGPALPIPANVGDSVVVYGTMDADGADYLTVSSATADSIEVSFQWGSASIDLDMYLTDAAGTLNVCGDDFFACDAGTGAHPEVGIARLTAGTTYELNLFLFDDGGLGLPIGYRLVVYKR